MILAKVFFSRKKSIRLKRDYKGFLEFVKG
jgi:hypothetical protein